MPSDRRRIRTAQEKSALLAEVDAEGGKVRLVARRHNISESLLYNWRSARKAAALAMGGAGECGVHSGRHHRRSFFAHGAGGGTGGSGTTARARDLAQAGLDKGSDGRLLASIDDPCKFCDAIRTVSRRVSSGVRYVVSPYTFRHAVSADLKKQGFSVETIARWFGHQSGLSQRGYPLRISAGRPHVLATKCRDKDRFCPSGPEDPGMKSLVLPQQATGCELPRSPSRSRERDPAEVLERLSLVMARQ